MVFKSYLFKNFIFQRFEFFPGKLQGAILAPALHPFTGGPGKDFDAESSLVFPEVLSFGLAYRPTDSLTVAVEFEWTGWSSFDRVDVDLKNEISKAGISDFILDYDYKDSWFYKVGIDYRLTPEFSIRAGYAYVETPAPSRTLNPANPDADPHNFSLGFGYKKDKWRFDFFYIADKFEKCLTNKGSHKKEWILAFSSLSKFYKRNYIRYYKVKTRIFYKCQESEKFQPIMANFV